MDTINELSIQLEFQILVISCQQKISFIRFWKCHDECNISWIQFSKNGNSTCEPSNEYNDYYKCEWTSPDSFDDGTHSYDVTVKTITDSEKFSGTVTIGIYMFIIQYQLLYNFVSKRLKMILTSLTRHQFIKRVRFTGQYSNCLYILWLFSLNVYFRNMYIRRTSDFKLTFVSILPTNHHKSDLKHSSFAIIEKW